MAQRVSEILDILFSMMPEDLKEDYDNVGLLAGSSDNIVNSALVALDLNTDVVNEAVKKGAELIITHHPILFHARRNLREDDYEGKMLCALVRSGVSHIAMHTNFDNAPVNVSDALAHKLRLSNIENLDSGMRVGVTDISAFGEFMLFTEKVLGGAVRGYGHKEDRISRVAVLGGSGGSYADIALASGADVYLTGEISYHTACDMELCGMKVIEAGHAATEYPAVDYLVNALSKVLDVKIIKSEYIPFF